jgi:hypothetical protein
LAGLVIGIWAMIPPYVGPGLNTAASAEFADHVVPGVVVVAVSLAALWLGERGPNGVLLFAGGLVIVLAGLWMIVTHVPLVAQANRGDASWPAVIHHSLPDVFVFFLGVAWAAWYWADLDMSPGAGRQSPSTTGPGASRE